MKLSFCDTETLGLDPDRHPIWEVALIQREPDGSNRKVFSWQLNPISGRTLRKASPEALQVNHFYARYGSSRMVAYEDFAEEFVRLTAETQLVGAIVSFDEERLRRLCLDMGQCPAWHYKLIDVEALAGGFVNGDVHAADPFMPPWTGDAISDALGIDRDHPNLVRHTALGDAHWAEAVWDAVLGIPNEAVKVHYR